jgi:hypothetical protein
MPKVTVKEAISNSFRAKSSKKNSSDFSQGLESKVYFFVPKMS